jgi:hypothetical protein
VFWYSLPGSSALVEHWDGSAWSIVPVRRPRHATSIEFSGVSCPGPKDCIAVGSFRRLDAGLQAQRQPLAEHWDGRSWVVEVTPNPDAPEGSSLDGVACSSGVSCEAVGNYSYAGTPFRDSIFALGWDGKHWIYQDQPNPGQLPKNYERGVSCFAPGVCTSVGTWNGAKRYHALAERWDGAAWTRERVPNPQGFQDSELNDVSCSAATECVAVGYWRKSKYGRGGGLLVARWDGTAWSLDSPPEPPNSKGGFNGVTCLSVISCVAVGARATKSGEATLVEVYSG